MKKITPFKNPEIEYIFDQYPPKVREKCLQLRQLIFDIGSKNPDIGPIEETLRWGEPSYITSQSKSGSLIRIHHYKSKPFDFAMYFHCGTNLVNMFKDLYPDSFRFGGNRSLEFMLDDPIPINELKECITLALTYNTNK